MAKVLTAQQRTNKNNKDRGKSFEKKIALLLEWYRVPLSGSSSVFGWCDVRDSENINDGVWLGECKTMTPNNQDDKMYTIKLEWINKLLSRSSEENKMPVLIFTLFGNVDKFVAMPRKLMELIDSAIPHISATYDKLRVKRQSKNHKNYTISRKYLMDYKFRAIRASKINTLIWDFGFEDETDGSGWVFMHLNEFSRFHKDTRLSLVREEYYGILKRGGE